MAECRTGCCDKGPWVGSRVRCGYCSCCARYFPKNKNPYGPALPEWDDKLKKWRYYVSINHYHSDAIDLKPKVKSWSHLIEWIPEWWNKEMWREFDDPE